MARFVAKISTISMRLALAWLVSGSALGGALEEGWAARPAPNASLRAGAELRPGYAADVYLLRGFADIFSRGLDELGSQLGQRGVKVQVVGHGAWETVAAAIIAKQKRYGRRPVILIGHSLGANAVILLAERLRAQHIEVQYLVTFAATAPDPIPENVDRVANYYFATHGWGERVVGGVGFHGALENNDYSQARDIGHFNIEKQAAIHEQIIRNVLRIIRPPGGADARS